MATQALAIANEYRSLPLVQLQESPTNPRRRFDARGLEELAASFRSQGVLQPLLVRPSTDEGFEVIAGARRLRAARMAELEAVPVRVVELSDAEAIEAQAIENLQREEIHPLEEALAYKNMLDLDAARFSVAGIAEKVGKSPAYITQRLRLTELVDSVAQAFLEDQIGVGHALEIAKLQPSEQERAFAASFRETWTGSTNTRVLLPVRALVGWVEQNILLDLGSVPFDKADESLLPEAGSCATCPKRTGFNTLLFGDGGPDSCTDAVCFNGKMSNFITMQVNARPNLVQISTGWGAASGSGVLARGHYVPLQLGKKGARKGPLAPNQKPCKHMKEAIVAEGAERGILTKVCSEPTCAIHFPDRRLPDPKEIEKQKEARRKELLKRKVEATVRHRLLAEVLKKVGAPLDRADLVLILQSLLDQANPVRRETLARRSKLPPAQLTTSTKVHGELVRLLKRSDEIALSKLLVEWVLMDDVESNTAREPEYLTQAAKQHRIDATKVRKAVEQEFAAKEAKAAAKQEKAEKPSPPSTHKPPAAKKKTTGKKQLAA